jgi:SAM-dependent methyltransferase
MTPTPDPRGFEQLPGLSTQAFSKVDNAPDDEFYLHPRFVTHIDEGAIAAVTAIYRAVLPVGGEILDLMSSWISHLPPEIDYCTITGLGMNAEELAVNSRLTARIVQDLNSETQLPFADATFDGACVCVSVQYLQRPVDVFREVHRALKPDAPFIVSFSNRCFPTKAVAIWQALSGADQWKLIGSYMKAAGFENLTGHTFVPPDGDPLRAVIGRRSLVGQNP